MYISASNVEKKIFLVMAVHHKRGHSTNNGLRTHHGQIPQSVCPKFKSQSPINIWDLDVIFD